MMIAELKESCERCKGTGHQPGRMAAGIPQINVNTKCAACNGRGYRLTELGQDLLRLMSPFVEELVDQRIALRLRSTPGESSG